MPQSVAGFRRICSYSILWLLCVSAPAVQAEIRDDTAPGFSGSFALKMLSDDNIYRTETGQTSDMAFIIAPTLEHISVFSKHRLDLGYAGKYAMYSDYSDESFSDTKINGDFLLDLSTKLDLSLGT